jgi:hypothetical protein
MAAIAHHDLLPLPERQQPASHDPTTLAPVIALRPSSRRLPRHVYVRRRVVVLSVAVLAIAGCAVLTGRLASGMTTGSAADSPASVDSPVLVADLAAFTGRPVPGGAVYVVQPGDTLWKIARELRPDGDPRPLVDRLIDVNGDQPLAVGERLRLS